MTTIPINIAIEDDLSDAVIRRLLSECPKEYSVGATYGRSGFGYLRKTINGWNRAAKGIPFILLTDLDDALCAPTLIHQWLNEPKSPNLLFRVAVQEVEAWLLADATNLSEYLKVPPSRFPSEPDSVTDPKGYLIELAKTSRSRELRQQIAPKPGTTAKQGPEYNPMLTAFVREHWDVSASAETSPSLARTRARLAEYTPVWST